MSASEDSIFTRPFAPMLFDVVRAHAPYCYRCPLGLERATCAIECLALGDPRTATLALLEQHGDTVAAVIVEPMLQGAGGMIVWPARVSRRRPAAVRPLRHAADCRRGAHRLRPHRTDVRLRARRRHARHHLPVEGADRRLPAARRHGHDRARSTTRSSATTGRRTFFHGHSFTANPLACAVAIASLDLFRETDALEQVRRLERWLRERARAAARAADRSATFACIGGVGVVELVADKATQVGRRLPRRHRPAADAGVSRPRPAAAAARQRALLDAAVRDHRAETAWAIEQVRDVLASFRMT